jgi:uncharacterized lipoprotein YajG
MNKLVVILIGILSLTGCETFNKTLSDLKDLVTPAEVPTEVK